MISKSFRFSASSDEGEDGSRPFRRPSSLVVGGDPDLSSVSGVEGRRDGAVDGRLRPSDAMSVGNEAAV